MPISDQRTYWVQIFDQTTWREFLDFGGGVTGFRDTRWKHIQRLKPGDRLLCYLRGVSKWIGVLEVAAEPYLDTTPIWKQDTFPCRVDVKIIAGLPLERAIPVMDFRNRVSILREKYWSLHFVSSPSRWKPEDAQIIETAILNLAEQLEI